MKLRGHLYEVTDFDTFVRSYLTDPHQPDPESVRPLKQARVVLSSSDRAAAGSHRPVESESDGNGYFELDGSNLPNLPVFLVASRLHGDAQTSDRPEPLPGPLYRSASFPASSIDDLARNIYVASEQHTSGSGFSQTELVEILQQTKTQVRDIESMTGLITSDGISLTGKGKGVTASVRVGFTPDWSSDLTMVVSHSMTDFRLDLPGPAWLVGLVVSKDEIKESIRAGVQDLAAQINDRLKNEAVRRFASKVALDHEQIAAMFASQASLSLERILYPVVSSQEDRERVEIRAIAGDACLGFPLVLYGREPI